MRFESHMQHTLAQLRSLKEIYENPLKTNVEELFVATEYTTHGFIEAGEFIHLLRSVCTNKAKDDYLAYMHAQWEAIQKFDNLKNNMHDVKLIKLMYQLDGGYFEKGRRHPEKLLIVFTTMFNNFYLSNLVLLTFLRQFGISVLILKDASLFNYLNGVSGVGKNLQEVSQAVKNIVMNHGIKETFITGFSSGGYASLLFSTLIRCRGYLGFSIRSDLSSDSGIRAGKFFTQQVREKVASEWLVDLAGVIATRRDNVRRKIIYGVQEKTDREHALNLQGIESVTVKKIEGCGHVTISAMLVNNTLEQEFRSLLFDI